MPKYECLNRNDFSLHILCQKGDAHMVEWSIRSFLGHSGLCPKIVIHDDGTMTARSVKMLENHFSNLKVLPKSEAQKMLENHPDFSGRIKEYSRRGHKTIIQLIDIFLLSDTPKIMLMDGDILFFKKPEEIVDFVSGYSDCDALVSKQYGTYDLKVSEAYYRKHNLDGRMAGFMNPGVILLNKFAISTERFREFFENTRRGDNDYFFAMSGWSCLISQLNYKFLPEDKYIMKGRPKEDTIMKHFTNPRRHELFAYGIDSAKIKTSI